MSISKSLSASESFKASQVYQRNIIAGAIADAVIAGECNSLLPNSYLNPDIRLEFEELGYVFKIMYGSLYVFFSDHENK